MKGRRVSESVATIQQLPTWFVPSSSCAVPTSLKVSSGQLVPAHCVAQAPTNHLSASMPSPTGFGEIASRSNLVRVIECEPMETWPSLSVLSSAAAAPNQSEEPLSEQA